MRFRRWLVVLMALALFAAACGDDDDDSATAGGDDDTETTEGGSGADMESQDVDAEYMFYMATDQSIGNTAEQYNVSTFVTNG